MLARASTNGKHKGYVTMFRFWDEGHYGTIPSAFWKCREQLGISASEVLVLAYLLHRLDVEALVRRKGRFAYPDIHVPTVAAETGLSERTIQTVIRTLRPRTQRNPDGKGLIKRIGKYNRMYRYNLRPLFDAIAEICRDGRSPNENPNYLAGLKQEQAAQRPFREKSKRCKSKQKQQRREKCETAKRYSRVKRRLALVKSPPVPAPAQPTKQVSPKYGKYDTGKIKNISARTQFEGACERGLLSTEQLDDLFRHCCAFK